MINDYEFWANLAPWEKYKSDVVIKAHHILTEPVCPTVTIEFELSRCPIGYIAGAYTDTIEEAIEKATNKAIEKLTAWQNLTVAEICEMEGIV